jgi:hypothetical protein
MMMQCCVAAGQELVHYCSDGVLYRLPGGGQNNPAPVFGSQLSLVMLHSSRGIRGVCGLVCFHSCCSKPCLVP